MSFELNFLASYDDESLLAEIRRVGALVADQKLTRTAFAVHSKVGASTIRRRFGSWGAALERAGLGHRFEASSLRKTDAANLQSKDEHLALIRALAAQACRNYVTRQEFAAHTGTNSGRYLKLFGSWKNFLKEANLEQAPLARRYSDEQCYENLLAVWTEYGRSPQHDEMNAPPSTVGSKAYVRRWGTWRKALAAFVERVNQSAGPIPEEPPRRVPPEQHGDEKPLEVMRAARDIPLGLRYFVLKRDSFRCVGCGRSPATEYGLVLHVDHMIPWSKGGTTAEGNLRTLCSDCNLGKGAHH